MLNALLKRILAIFGMVTCVLGLLAIYLESIGRPALDRAYKNYTTCQTTLAEWSSDGRSVTIPERPAEAICLERYIDNRERIRWRYFFVRTAISHL